MNRDEQQLAEGLRQHRPSALERLMDTYGQGVYGLVSRILAGAGQAEDVEECVSDVFLSAWRRIGEYDREKGSLRTWLLILAKYAALDARRKLLRSPGAEPFEDRDKAGANVEEAVISKEANAELIATVNALPEPDRTIFYRRYFYYETVEQIANGLRLTGKAVENRLYRLRKRFKAKLGEGGNE
ncbi:MAG: hypothetical protein K0Q59_309 [Paenibacillus sp.]|nr:hypothetical protein [Paenibacillus sp.]